MLECRRKIISETSLLLVLSLITVGSCQSYYYPYPFQQPCPQPQPTFPCIPASDETSPITNCSLSPNNFVLVLDPVTNSLSLQIIPPTGCANGTKLNGTDPGTGPNPPGNGADPGNNNGGGTGVCSLITLITQLVQSLLENVRKLLSSLVSSLLQLLNSLLQSLLNGLLSSLNKLLKEAVTGVLGNLNNLVKSLGLGGGDPSSPLSVLDTLLKSLQGPLSAAAPGPISGLTNVITELVTALRSLLQSLLDPSSGQALLPQLTQNISSLLNDTINDLDKTVTDLLDDLLSSNGSLTANLTKNLEVLLTAVLNDTICDLEKLLNDTGSLAAVISDVEKLLDDLLKDLAENLGNTLDTLLSDLLNKLVDDLLKNIEKLVINLFSNLLNEKIDAVKNSPLMDPNSTLMQNLTDALKNLPSVPGLPPTSELPLPGGLPLPLPAAGNSSILPTDLLSPVLKGLNDTVVGLVESLRKLLTSLEPPGGNSMSPVIEGPVRSLLDAVTTLLRNLLKSLLGDLRGLVDNQLGNITGAIGLQNITSPVGTLVTGLLKGLLGCNLTCSQIPPKGPPTGPPTGQPSSPTPGGPFPFDPSCFTELLELYQEAITSSFKTSASRVINSCVCGDEMEDDYYDDNNELLEDLPNQLLQGVDQTVELTNGLTSCGLPALLSSTLQNSNDRPGSSEIKLPIAK